MKYVIVDNLGCELAIIFNEIVDHALVAEHGKIVSAGFCCIVDNKVSVWGKSLNLKIGSRPEDAEIIKQSIEFRC